MFFFWVNFLGLLFLSACSSTGPSDSSNTTPIIPIYSTNTERPPSDPSFPQAKATGTFVYSAAKSLSDPSYLNPKKDHIVGTCSIKKTTSGNIEIPCANLIVVLRNKAGKEIKRTVISDQAFSFAVANEEQYWLTVESSSFKLTNTMGPVRRGDALHLALVPK